MPRFVDISGSVPIAAAADARAAIGATEVGAAVFTASNQADARAAIGSLTPAAELGPVSDDSVASHPLSEVYGTLAAAQADFPFVTSLSQERDWASIQKALDDLPTGYTKTLMTSATYRLGSGGTVNLEARVYNLGSDSLSIQVANTALVGNGAVLHYSGTGDAIVRGSTNTTPYGFGRIVLRDFTLRSTYSADSPSSGGRHGINITRWNSGECANVMVYGFAGTGIVLPECQWIDFNGVESMYNGGYGFLIDDSVKYETTLAADLSSAETTSMTANWASGSGVGLGAGEVRIGQEIIGYTSRTDTTPTATLSGLTRGMHGTSAAAHSTADVVSVMSGYRTNNVTFTRCRAEGNAQGGAQILGGHANSWLGSTLQFSGRNTTTTADINASVTTIPANTYDFAPRGWAVIGNETFWYDGLGSGSSFENCVRGAKGSTAQSHTSGTRISQGVGLHIVSGDSFANSFNGHLEQNLWHAFIEADNAATAAGRPRGTALIAPFFVIDDKCERFVVNQGNSTSVIGGCSQNDAATMLTRNSVKTPFEDHSVSGTMTITGFPAIDTNSSGRLVTDQLGNNASAAWNGGSFTSLGHYGFRPGYGLLGHLSTGTGRVYARLSTTDNRVEIGSTQQPLYIARFVNSVTLSSNGAATFYATVGAYKYVLQANATSSTILSAGTGQLFTMIWEQDVVGGRTYAWPSNCRFAGGSAPSDTTASTRTAVTFELSGSTWLELSRSVAVPVT